MTRRRLLGAGAWAGLAAATGGCGVQTDQDDDGGRGAGDGALTARPGGAPSEPLPPAGVRPLGLDTARDALLLVPAGLRPDAAAPLVVCLHGAGGTAADGLSLLAPLADERGLVLLAPASRGPTWDGVRGDHGPDVDLLDRALDRVFRAVPVDPGRIALAGFSDGASAALGLGLANGDLVSDVLAFSPGFVTRARRAGRPSVFVSHGTADAVLPVDRTSRRIVPALRRDGYDVTYREFDGPHAVPPQVAEEAADRLGRG